MQIYNDIHFADPLYDVSPRPFVQRPVTAASVVWSFGADLLDLKGQSQNVTEV
jgi:hypothetical protein